MQFRYFHRSPWANPGHYKSAPSLYMPDLSRNRHLWQHTIPAGQNKSGWRPSAQAPRHCPDFEWRLPSDIHQQSTQVCLILPASRLVLTPATRLQYRTAIRPKSTKRWRQAYKIRFAVHIPGIDYMVDVLQINKNRNAAHFRAEFQRIFRYKKNYLTWYNFKSGNFYVKSRKFW